MKEMYISPRGNITESDVMLAISKLKKMPKWKKLKIRMNVILDEKIIDQFREELETCMRETKDEFIDIDVEDYYNQLVIYRNAPNLVVMQMFGVSAEGVS